jgi:hypothetical protein
MVTKSAELPTETYLGSQHNKEATTYLTTEIYLCTQHNRVAANTFLLLPILTPDYSMARNPSSQANSVLGIKNSSSYREQGL